jgi:hypothetical protein
MTQIEKWYTKPEAARIRSSMQSDVSIFISKLMAVNKEYNVPLG